MKFNVNIKNFGKIQDANIALSNFTIIAGKNGCGKSFVTKAFYSFFNTINRDHFTKALLNNVEATKFFSDRILYSGKVNKKESVYLSLMIESAEDCIKFTQEFLDDHYLSEQFRLTEQLEKKLTGIIKHFKSFQVELGTKKKKESFLGILNSLENHIYNLNLIAQKPSDTIANSIQQDFEFELMENFQVAKLSQLINYKSNKEFTFNFGELGYIRLVYDEKEKKELITFKLNPASIDQFQQLNNIVYIESPIFWKMRPALNMIKRGSFLNRSYRSKFMKKELLGVPKYFFDLSNLLETNYTLPLISSKFENISKIIKDKIGGKFDISENGDIFFSENNSKSQNLSLYLTAAGITNLGMISLLLDKGIISDGSYIFIDEPEINLHPDWQKTMIECLFELSKSNVNVVIATHSIDMIKCIELLVHKNENLVNNNHFAINQLSPEGILIDTDEDVLGKLKSIKDDLGESFLKMFFEENE